MRARPRFVGRLCLADAVTVANAALGFVAVALAPRDPWLAARLVLVAAIADGLDGVIARKRGSSDVGEFLDSLADVASFAVAPAALVFAAVGRFHAGPIPLAAAVGGALFVSAAVVRLGLYTAFDLDAHTTEGVQSTLAATVMAAALLAAPLPAPELTLVLTGAMGLFVYLMVAPVTYPELYARDALAMGGVQALAVLFPDVLAHLFPRALLVAALSYLLLAPRFYWR